MKFDRWTGTACAVFLFFSFGGCVSVKPDSSSKNVMDDYLSRVVKHDGVNREEALTLARSQLVFQGRDKDFFLDRVEYVSEQPDFWEISFVPRNRTLSDVISRSKIVVLVLKTSGEAFLEER